LVVVDRRPRRQYRAQLSIGVFAMMNGMMGQGMLWGMGIGWIVIFLLVVLAIAALVKYLFFP
jgi:hypothetical protein